MAKENPKIKMSVYKIDYLKVKKLLGIDEGNAIAPVTAVVAVMDDLIKRLGRYAYRRISVSEVEGIVFNTYKEADIAPFIQDMLISGRSLGDDAYGAILSEELLQNRSTSLILFSIQGEAVYLLAGARGAAYVKGYVVSDFATNLLTKIYEEKSEAVSQSGKSHLLGDVTSTRTTTKSKRSFIDGSQIGTVLKDCEVHLEKEQQEALGFMPEFPYKDKIANVTSASFKLKQSLTLGEFKTLLRSIAKLDRQDSRFIVNNLVPVKNFGIQERDLENALIGGILTGDRGSSVKTVGAGSESYPWSDWYRIIYKGGGDINQAFMKSDSPIEFEDVVRKLKSEGDFDERHLKRILLKSNLVTTLEGGVTHKDVVIASVQAVTVLGDVEYFLYGGHWYCIPSSHDSLLQKRFGMLYEKSVARAKALRGEFGLSCKESVGVATEDAYNEALRERRCIVVGHKALVSNVELADLLFKYDGVVYLVHNKQKFDGPGARDVVGQALSAARLWQDRLHSDQKKAFLDDYYDRISACYERRSRSVPVSKESFRGLFSGSPKLCIATGYISGLRGDSESSYAKLISCDAEKQLKDFDIDFMLLDLV